MTLTSATSSRVAFRFESVGAAPLLQAMSGRAPGAPSDGDVGYSPTSADTDIDANRSAFAAEAGFDLAALTLGKQTHGTQVQIVTRAERGRGQAPRFDGFPA